MSTTAITTLNPELKSPAFADGHSIPRRYTADGENLSPPLQWSTVPPEAESLAVICEDPDASTNVPWVHWVLFNLPASLVSLAEGLPRHARLAELHGAVQGMNSWDEDNIGYRGPAPPCGDGVHHYVFKLYVLDIVLGHGTNVTKDELLLEMHGHIIGRSTLVGIYERE